MKATNRMFRVYAACLCALMLMLPAAAHAALTDAELLTAARAFLPANAEHVRTEKEDGYLEYEFSIPTTWERYEVRLHPTTGAVFSVESDLPDQRGAAATLTAEAAGAAVQAEFPDATLEILYVSFEQERGGYVCMVLVRSAGMLGAYELHAETGAVLGRQLFYEQTAGEWQNIRLPEQIAAELRAAHAGLTDLYLDIDEDDGWIYYTGDATVSGMRYEFEIDIMTGVTYEWDND